MKKKPCKNCGKVHEGQNVAEKILEAIELLQKHQQKNQQPDDCPTCGDGCDPDTRKMHVIMYQALKHDRDKWKSKLDDDDDLRTMINQAMNIAAGLGDDADRDKVQMTAISLAAVIYAWLGREV